MGRQPIGGGAWRRRIYSAGPVQPAPPASTASLPEPSHVLASVRPPACAKSRTASSARAGPPMPPWCSRPSSPPARGTSSSATRPRSRSSVRLLSLSPSSSRSHLYPRLVHVRRRARSSRRFLGIYTIFFAGALLLMTTYKRPLPVDWGLVAATSVLYVLCIAVSLLPDLVIFCNRLVHFHCSRHSSQARLFHYDRQAYMFQRASALPCSAHRVLTMFPDLPCAWATHSKDFRSPNLSSSLEFYAPLTSFSRPAASCHNC